MQRNPIVPPRIQAKHIWQQMTPIKIERRQHPKEGDGWCNLCERKGAMDGIIIEYDRSDAPKFLFFCVECVQTLAKLV